MGNIEKLRESAVASESYFVGAFGVLARESNMAIGITFLEKYELLLRNTFCLFNRFGSKILTYAKGGGTYFSA